MEAGPAGAADPLARLAALPWMQPLLRDEAIQSLLQDEAVQSLLQDESILGILSSDAFASIARSPRFVELVSSPRFLAMARTDEFRARARSPAFRAQFADLPELPNMKEIKDRGYHGTTVVDAFQRARARYVAHDKDRIMYFYDQLCDWSEDSDASTPMPRFVERRAEMFRTLVGLQRQHGFKVIYLTRACKLADLVLIHD